MVDIKEEKKKFLITLSGNALDIMEFLKQRKGLDPSPAIALVLNEWFENHAKSAASAPLKPREMSVDMDSGATTVPKPLLSDVRPHEDIEVVPDYQ